MYIAPAAGEASKKPAVAAARKAEFSIGTRIETRVVAEGERIAARSHREQRTLHRIERLAVVSEGGKKKSQAGLFDVIHAVTR